ncbi:DUF927 domain-containing protein [Solibacillus sp. FSL K6-1554]|uniref:DUF927 domain-containing protein n=1 Tax=Solibacillus sp. FSL K6-1554 TaxID=2921472 RepID=UPI0030FA5EAE
MLQLKNDQTNKQLLDITQDLKMQGYSVYSSYKITPKNVYVKEDESSEYSKFCDLLYIDRCIQDYRTEKVSVQLCIRVQEQTKFLTFPMKFLQPAELLGLNDYGYPMSIDLAKILSKYLLKQVKHVPFEIHYDSIGFLQKESGIKPVYALEDTFGNVDNKNFKVHSQLAKFNLKPNGSLEGWIRGVQKHVVGQIPLEFILGVSFSALVLGYQKVQGKQVHTSISHLVGASTTGKTTASLLAISVFGKPAKEQGSLYQSFNATQNSLINKLGHNYGVCYVMDEFSMSRIKDTTSMVYTIAEGYDKDRLDENSSLKDAVSWAMSLITNGENSILEMSNKNLGLEVRLQEYKDIKWTSSSDHAESIHDFIIDHYGHAGIAYAKYVASDWTMIDLATDDWTAYFKENLPASPIKNRLAPKYATILAGLQLAGEALDMAFHLEEVAHFIIGNEEELSYNRDIAEWVYGLVVEHILTHEECFEIDGKEELPETVIGKISHHDNRQYKVNIKADYLKKVLSKLGYSNTALIFKALKRKPYFKSELNRQTTRTAIAGEREVTYEFLVPKDAF